MAAPSQAFTRFDESTYLARNPDVAGAVRNGAFASGLEHYITFGCTEDRPGVPREVVEAVRDITIAENACPPEHLRKRVHGDAGLATFVNVGRLVAFKIHSLITPLSPLDTNSRILDFGCGCGRVIQSLRKLAPHSAYFGTDIDAEAIGWCRRELSHVGTFERNNPSPPLPFSDEFFDLVYAISVFTHLPEDMELAWLGELRRVTRRGGHLLLTSHGEDLLKPASDETGRMFRERGFAYSVGPGTEGLPDFYQTSFHTDAYLQRQWGRFFEIRAIIKKGIVNHQDIVVCRRAD